MEYERVSSHQKQKSRSNIFSCCFGQTDACDFPEIKEKCRNVFSRIGRNRRQSSEFRYDPLSYALNFDEGFDDSRFDEFPPRNFSARLPVSPPSEETADATPMVVRREIIRCK